MKACIMRKPEEMEKELKKIEWYGLGYDGGIFTYIKDLKEISKNRSRGAIKAEIDIYAGSVQFTPCYKRKFDMVDVIAAFKCANQFMEIANKYDYEWRETYESAD